MELLDATNPAVQAFVKAWHENGRAGFARSYSNLDYDAYEAKRATTRRRWITLDRGDSGHFLVDRATGDVYTIKAYGTPNRKVGTLTGLTAEYEAATATYAQRGA